MFRKHTYDYEPEAGLNLPVVHCGFARVVSFVLAVYSYKHQCYSMALSAFFYVDSANKTFYAYLC
jgi:hypothetical protein